MNGESKGIKEGNKLSIFTQTDKMYLEYKKLSVLTLKKEKKKQKMGNDWKIHQRATQMVGKHVKRCPISLGMREIQNEISSHIQQND